jgi:hypothetical protein
MLLDLGHITPTFYSPLGVSMVISSISAQMLELLKNGDGLAASVPLQPLTRWDIRLGARIFNHLPGPVSPPNTPSVQTQSELVHGYTSAPYFVKRGNSLKTENREHEA